MITLGLNASTSIRVGDSMNMSARSPYVFFRKRDQHDKITVKTIVSHDRDLTLAPESQLFAFRHCFS